MKFQILAILNQVVKTQDIYSMLLGKELSNMREFAYSRTNLCYSIVEGLKGSAMYVLRYERNVEFYSLNRVRKKPLLTTVCTENALTPLL